MENRLYNIGGFALRVNVTAGLPPTEMLLPTFTAFEETARGKECAMQVTISTLDGVSKPKSAKVLDTTVDIMGETCFYTCDKGYYAETLFGNALKRHRIYIDETMSKADIGLDCTDLYVATCATTLMQLFFSLAIIKHDAVMVHASAVRVGQKGYVFLGKSGTGKSTHSRMWIKAIKDAELLNDDNPIIRRLDDPERYEVCGTPWSGKTPCYVNKCCELGGIVRLEQGAQNRVKLLEPMEAFIAVIPSCSVINSEQKLLDKCNDTVISLAERAKVALMRCLPNEDAAKICYVNLK